MAMTIKNGIANIKAFIARDVSYATFLSGGSWKKTTIKDIRQLSGDRVGIYVQFGKDAPNTINGIRLYGQDGKIWAESTDLNLTKTKSAQGFLYRFTIHVVQEAE